MAPRASSPALSENEVDISNALFGGADINGDGLTGFDNAHTADIGLALDVGDDGSDDEAFIAAQQAASNRKASNLKGKTVKKGGGFQAMGLNGALLKAITLKGFSVPTPIQRKAIPLILEGQDLVGMARTGSGKTAAFVIPMIEKLKAHSAKFGARAIILSPNRELALQTMKVVKEFGKGTDLRTILLVGGDSLEEQFASMTTNPDIIIATPGRFLHLKVEMGLDLSSVQYIVFDEADRLFEMGFATQLSEIIHSLPTSRQTLLFSATLPKSLAEFARAGLQEPKLIRLDAESKVSPDLESAFFTVKSADRDGALFYLLDKVIKVPTGSAEALETTEKNPKKRKRAPEATPAVELPHSTIIFGATKHRVEYLATLLDQAGYRVSFVYGSLDQTARKAQIQKFRDGSTNVLVVTDVAARGIDLPHLSNVIQYDFAHQPKIFVHRVGRTARAGRKGWSYSLVRDSDVPYLLDLQLFLGKRLVDRSTSEDPNFASDVVVGSLVEDHLQPSVELVMRLLAENTDLQALQSVAAKGESQYLRTRPAASAESVKRTKSLLSSGNLSQIHPLFGNELHDALREKGKMLERIRAFRPTESVFEIGRRGTADETAEVMRKTREKIENQKRKKQVEDPAPGYASLNHAVHSLDETQDREQDEDMSQSDSELEVTITESSSRTAAAEDWQSSPFFMSYLPRHSNLAEEKAYGVQQSASFVEEARGAQVDLVEDESRGFSLASKPRGMRWDKRSKKYVARVNDEDGSKGTKMVIGESGLKIAATFRSGRWDEWRKSNKIGRLPRVGEVEAPNRAVRHSGGRYFKHRAEKAPKEADRYRDDYHVQKKRVDEAKQKRIGKFKDGNAKSELKGVEHVRKQRKLEQKRREKNARPSKKRKL